MQKQPQKFIFQLIFLLSMIYSFMPVGGVLAEKVFNWKSLRSAAPSGLLEQVQKDYTTDANLNQPVDVGQMQLLLVQQSKAKPLFLINTRLPGQTPDANPTCGQAGCLFYGYTKSGQRFVQVLNGYINDFRLQDAPPPIQPTNQVVNQLPCLQLTFYKSQFNQLLTSKLCFDGKEYQPTSPPVVLRQLKR
jgi:hypothetical protein